MSGRPHCRFLAHAPSNDHVTTSVDESHIRARWQPSTNVDESHIADDNQVKRRRLSTKSPKRDRRKLERRPFYEQRHAQMHAIMHTRMHACTHAFTHACTHEDIHAVDWEEHLPRDRNPKPWASKLYWSRDRDWLTCLACCAMKAADMHSSVMCAALSRTGSGANCSLCPRLRLTSHASRDVGRLRLHSCPGVPQGLRGDACMAQWRRASKRLCAGTLHAEPR